MKINIMINRDEIIGNSFTNTYENEEIRKYDVKYYIPLEDEDK